MDNNPKEKAPLVFKGKARGVSSEIGEDIKNIELLALMEILTPIRLRKTNHSITHNRANTKGCSVYFL